MTNAAPEPVRWDGERLDVLDQRLLPGTTSYERQTGLDSVWTAIRALKVRGAPAIGIAAAYGLVVSMQPYRGASPAAFFAALDQAAARLRSARPTAVNLGWALDRLTHVAREIATPTEKSLYAAVLREAETIHREDRRMCPPSAAQVYR
jgi:methylthioribose-1-phosphate isomerase